MGARRNRYAVDALWGVIREDERGRREFVPVLGSSKNGVLNRACDHLGLTRAFGDELPRDRLRSMGYRPAKIARVILAADIAKRKRRPTP